MLRNGGETNQELGDSGDRLEKVASNIFLCTRSITLHRLHPNLKINNVHALPITVIVASCFCSRSTTQGRGNTTNTRPCSPNPPNTDRDRLLDIADNLTKCGNFNTTGNKRYKYGNIQIRFCAFTVAQLSKDKTAVTRRLHISNPSFDSFVQWSSPICTQKYVNNQIAPRMSKHK